MGAHNGDTVNNPASAEDYLSAGDVVSLLQTLAFDESVAYTVAGGNGQSGCLLIARIGRTSIKAFYGPGRLDDVAIHVHDTLDGAVECHQGSVQNAVDLATATGMTLQPV